METQVRPAEEDQVATIQEVLAALRKEGLEPKHESKDWGDWIHLEGRATVISIESLRGLSGSATIEHADDDPDEVAPSIFRAFHRLGWIGIDEDGEFTLA